MTSIPIRRPPPPLKKVGYTHVHFHILTSKKNLGGGGETPYPPPPPGYATAIKYIMHLAARISDRTHSR